MKYWLVLLLVLLRINNLHAQASDFYAYADSNKHIIYYEDFNTITTQSKKWLLDSPCINYTVSIHDGKLVMLSYNKEKVYFTYVPANIDYEKDFEIEFSAIDSGKNNFSLQGACFWGKDSTERRYSGQHVFFTNRGLSILEYCDGISDQPCHSDMKHYFGNHKNKYVTYTIRKVKDNYYCFYNGYYKGSTNYQKLYGTMIGFGAFSGNRVCVDYIKVSYLQQPALNNPIPLYKRPEYRIKEDIASNINISGEITYNCMRGRFLAHITIDTSGMIDTIEVNGAYEALNTAVKNAIKTTNNYWIPAHNNNKPFKATRTVVINIKPSITVTCPNYDYHYNLGMKYYKEDSTEMSLHHLKIAVGEDFSNIKALYNIAAIYINAEKYNDACYYLDRIIKLRSIEELDLKLVNEQISKTDTDNLIRTYCKKI